MQSMSDIAPAPSVGSVTASIDELSALGDAQELQKFLSRNALTVMCSKSNGSYDALVVRRQDQ